MEVLAAWTLWGNSAVMGRGMVPLLGSSQLKCGVGGRGVVCSRRQTKCRAESCEHLFSYVRGAAGTPGDGQNVPAATPAHPEWRPANTIDPL
eukprot:scaffold188812_cov26-Cyclotella_meneghiniana.AAC.1